MESLTDGGHIIDRHQELAFDLAELVSHAIKLFAGKHVFAVVILAAPIRWVEIEQRVTEHFKLDAPSAVKGPGLGSLQLGVRRAHLRFFLELEIAELHGFIVD